jgi:hypothetical protein
MAQSEYGKWQKVASGIENVSKRTNMPNRKFDIVRNSVLYDRFVGVD